MPLLLKKAHTNLDLTVETLYRNGSFEDDDERLKYLFKLFAKKKNKEILSNAKFCRCYLPTNW